MFRLSLISSLVVLLTAKLAFGQAINSPKPEEIWQALSQGGHIALIRHALAPGFGDPADFELNDCSTQRNLSQAGREQAAAIGQLFRDHQVPVERVLSSRWCRCLETARLLDLGSVEPMPILDSFFRQRERGPQQTAALEAFVSQKRPGTSLVMVTHQVNITALTGIFPDSGEIIVIQPLGEEGFKVLGRLPTLRES